MNTRHGDFWDHVLAVLNEASEECDKAIMEDKLDQFEGAWLARGGKVDRLTEHPWFADAKPAAKDIGRQTIRYEIKKMVEYYRWAEGILRP